MKNINLIINLKVIIKLYIWSNWLCLALNLIQIIAAVLLQVHRAQKVNLELANSTVLTDWNYSFMCKMSYDTLTI